MPIPLVDGGVNERGCALRAGCARQRPPPARPSGAVALLELLAGAAPARVVAADLLLVGTMRCPWRPTAAVGRLGGAAPSSGAAEPLHRARVRRSRRPRQRLVLVDERAVLEASARLRAARRSSACELDVEEVTDDLLADRSRPAPRTSRGPRRGTRRAGPSAPSRAGGCRRGGSPSTSRCSRQRDVDDLEDRKRSISRISSAAELLLLRLVRVARVVLELADQLLARHAAQVELVRLDLAVVEVVHLLKSASRSHSSECSDSVCSIDDALDDLVDPLADRPPRGPRPRAPGGAARRSPGAARS